MRIGLQIPNFTYPATHPVASTLKSLVQLADQGGFYSLWVMDHFFQIEYIGPAEWDMLEGYSTLSYFAALTQRVKLGTMVTGIVYRHPGLLVKTVTTLDTLSGGRAYLGIGAAWFEREARALGVPFPSLKTRFEQLEETLLIARQMWSPDNGPFQGRHYQLAETMCVPQPLSGPHPPILIGGGGERRTLRLVAQYGDACNFFLFLGPDALRAKFDILKRHCDAVRRPYAEIERTGLGTIRADMSSREAIETCRQAASAGFQHLIFNFENIHEVKPLERFVREVLPEVAGL
jgi:F420-dependent oxidoreductase-like protein